jgi:hypothetical protein
MIKTIFMTGLPFEGAGAAGTTGAEGAMTTLL